MAIGSSRPIVAAMKKNTGDTSSQTQLRVSQPDMPTAPTRTSTAAAPRPAVISRLPRLTCRRVVQTARTSAMAYAAAGVRIQSSLICSPSPENSLAMITPIDLVAGPIVRPPWRGCVGSPMTQADGAPR